MDTIRASVTKPPVRDVDANSAAYKWTRTQRQTTLTISALIIHYTGKRAMDAVTKLPPQDTELMQSNECGAISIFRTLGGSQGHHPAAPEGGSRTYHAIAGGSGRASTTQKATEKGAAFKLLGRTTTHNSLSTMSAMLVKRKRYASDHHPRTPITA